MAKQPKQQPGLSKQDYATPPEFLIAVRHLLGIADFVIDLAASAENAVCGLYYDEAVNSLDQPWTWPRILETLGETYTGPLSIPVPQWNWLNPPYGDDNGEGHGRGVEAWVRKAYTAMQLGANTAVLIPLSTSTYWHRWVHGKAHVLLLGGDLNSGRIKFVGTPAAYPKDCCLLLYGEPDRFPPAYDSWDWVAEYEAACDPVLPFEATP